MQSLRGIPENQEQSNSVATMSRTSEVWVRLLLIHLLLFLFLCPGIGPSLSAQESDFLADSVKAEFLHAWKGYKAYAWGHDALQPLSRTPHDWYKTSLYMTPVDAFDTMLLMGLTDEAAEAKELILTNLTFDHDMEVQAFEITIRLLGGLLSAYEMDGDERFLVLAEALGKCLLPIYETPTGIPKRYVNLRTGATRDSITNPAEIGTALLEFGTLSKHTGDRVYYNKAKSALVSLFNHRSKIGLVGTWINAETGEWTDKRSHIRGAIDSYYEYLIKAWLLFDDEECKSMWELSMAAINSSLADTLDGSLWYCQVNMETGEKIGTRYGSLDAFFPSVLCLAGDIPRAVQLQESSDRMWDIAGIEPEAIDYSTMDIVSKGYYLRPEIIESAYYLYHYTKDPRYVEMGKKYFRSIVKHCRTESGYAFLEDVVTKQQGDGMESFFLAETMKYLYLLLRNDNAFSLEEFVFNTEAHPLKRGEGMKDHGQANPYYSRTDTTRLNLPDSEWKKILSADVYGVARGKGTEQEFTGKYWNYDGIGSYYCAPCGNALFRSDSKFASSCGWPSFFETLRKDGVTYQADDSHGMQRTEVLCGRCGGHLGHLFDDGPLPTGKRYCMNSIVLEFEPNNGDGR